MARARNIKPGLFKNEILGQADPLYTLLFEGLWVLADREGRLENRPLRIKAEVFPYRDGLSIEGMLAWLEEAGFIVMYEVDNKHYIEVLNFKRHQNPHKNEQPSEIPNPSEGVPIKSGHQPNESEALGLIPDSLNPLTDSKKGASNKSKPPLIGLKKYLDDCRQANQPAIPEDHAVFRYAEEVGIPEHFLHLAWHAFADRYLGNNNKRYKDWPATFCNAVKGNWMKIWYVDQQGQHCLTTVGVQTERAYRAKEAA